MTSSSPHNPNSVPMACIIDVWLKNEDLGPPQPFRHHEARRYAIEQVRSGEEDGVVR